MALGLEVLWTRTLILTVGSSTQALALMLASFLGGIALGSALWERWAGRAGDPARAAAWLLVAMAAVSALLLRVAGELPYAYLALWEWAHGGGAALVLLRLALSVCLMLPAALLSGAALPALVEAAGRGRDSAAGDLGLVYAANTLGAVVGSLAVGLVLLPRLGVATSVGVVAGAGLLAAVAAAAAARRRGAAGARAVLAAAAAVAVLLAWTPRWDPRVMARGLAYLAGRAAELLREGRLREATQGVRTVFFRDGAESTVLVYDAGEGTLRSFVVNGRHEATSSPNDMRNQYLLGHLPALLHRGPVRDGLVIALGSGMTAGALRRHAERVTVVELEREVEEAARAFAQWNHDLLADPGIRLVIDDGRHHLLTTESSYDVITVDPIHPSVAGSDALYSLEQYRLVRRRLAPGGVAAQWLPLYQMGVQDARSIAATFLAAFPDAQVWVNGADAILIGGAGEAPRPAAEVRDALGRPGVAESLAVVRQGRLGTLLGGYVLGAPAVAAYAAGAPILRDDRPIVEYSLPWRIDEETVERNLAEIFRFAPRSVPIALDGLDAAQREEIERSRAAVGFDQVAVALRLVGHDEKMRFFFEEALALDPDDALARQALGR